MRFISESHRALQLEACSLQLECKAVNIMYTDLRNIIDTGPMTFVATPSSNVDDYKIHRTIYLPNGSTGGTLVYWPEQLTQGIEFTLKTKHTYELELHITPSGNLAAVMVHIGHNGKTLWKKECTWFGHGFNGKWKFTAK